LYIIRPIQVTEAGWKIARHYSLHCM
jgi:hypothetical protein